MPRLCQWRGCGGGGFTPGYQVGVAYLVVIACLGDMHLVSSILPHSCGVSTMLSFLLAGARLDIMRRWWLPGEDCGVPPPANGWLHLPEGAQVLASIPFAGSVLRQQSTKFGGHLVMEPPSANAGHQHRWWGHHSSGFLTTG